MSAGRCLHLLCSSAAFDSLQVHRCCVVGGRVQLGTRHSAPAHLALQRLPRQREPPHKGVQGMAGQGGCAAQRAEPCCLRDKLVGGGVAKARHHVGAVEGQGG